MAQRSTAQQPMAMPMPMVLHQPKPRAANKMTLMQHKMSMRKAPHEQRRMVAHELRPMAPQRLMPMATHKLMPMAAHGPMATRKPMPMAAHGPMAQHMLIH
jgi:hypothetical protein